MRPKVTTREQCPLQPLERGVIGQRRCDRFKNIQDLLAIHPDRHLGFLYHPVASQVFQKARQAGPRDLSPLVGLLGSDIRRHSSFAPAGSIQLSWPPPCNWPVSLWKPSVVLATTTSCISEFHKLKGHAIDMRNWLDVVNGSSEQMV